MIQITQEEYDELIKAKRLNEKLVPLFKYNIEQLKQELVALETIRHPEEEVSGFYLTHKAKLEKKIADFEELLK